MRGSSAALCDEFTRAESECFGRWCALFDGRAEPAPDAALASQSALHEAAGRLRTWCLADPAAAEAERQDLMVCQAEGELAAAAAVRAHRSAADRDRIRASWVTARWHVICQRDALTCGLGWPHRGEQVDVSTWYYDADGMKIPITGEGIYLNSYDIFEVSHQVWLPARSASRRRGTLLVRWSAGGDEGGPLGPADPAGDIGLRLRGAPGQRLPVPLMRWPGPADAGIDVPAPATPVIQAALFSVSELPGRLAGRRTRHRQGPHRRQKILAGAAAEATLF